MRARDVERAAQRRRESRHHARARLWSRIIAVALVVVLSVGAGAVWANAGKSDGVDDARSQSCAAPTSSSMSSSETTTTASTRSTLEDRFIVRMRSYEDIEAHERAVGAVLRRQRRASWRVLPRQNAAVKAYPTDFVVVETTPSGTSMFERARRSRAKDDALVSLREVLRDVAKDVHREQRITRKSLLQDGAGDDSGNEDEEDAPSRRRGRKLLQSSVAMKLNANVLWKQGYTGAGVKMAIFDTGIAANHPHFNNIIERTNWTNENQLEDGLGHGSFVAGVIAGTSKDCAGFAPDAHIHTFRVFTTAQNSYTSWFLDGFNYAIASGVHVLNLSIGGPDYLDIPFVDKVHEITASGIIMISAIGNDGPLYGTLNNPADNLDIIGIGGITSAHQIAAFSSRGMSTWELPSGYGRVKPDIVTYGDNIWGSKITGGCRSLSGTSVASPVAAGAAVLLSSILPESTRWSILNPAVMKQILVEGAEKLPGPHRYEQGAGKLNLLQSAEILKAYKPRASIIPSDFDLTQCPYAWPHCKQGIYATMMPLILNTTIANGLGAHGEVVVAPKFIPNDSDLGDVLDVRFSFSETLWPYSGYLALYIRVKDEGALKSGVASGRVTLTVASPGARGETALRVSEVEMTLKVNIIPTPPRNKRLLWDQFHNVRYPPGYIPRDNIDMKSDVLDWHGDHPHTNFHELYDTLTSDGYFVEVLGAPFTCFDAKNYGALLMVDLEEEYSEAEVQKLQRDVREEGLGVVLFAEWYNVQTMESMKFYDDNTHYDWNAATGGANIPALNDLLQPFGIQFGDVVTEKAGSAFPKIDDDLIMINSGTTIARAPQGTFLHFASLKDRNNKEPVVANRAFASLSRFGEGRVFAFVDSNCVDSSHMRFKCFEFFMRAVAFAAENECSAKYCDPAKQINDAYSDGSELPQRRSDVDFSEFSTVLGGHPGNEGSMTCGANSPLEFHTARVSYTDLPGRLKFDPKLVERNRPSSPQTVVPRDDDDGDNDDDDDDDDNDDDGADVNFDGRKTFATSTRDEADAGVFPIVSSTTTLYVVVIVVGLICVVRTVKRRRARRAKARANAPQIGVL